MTDLTTLAANAPKAELHLHIEGSFEPELMFEIARRNDVDLPFKSVEEIRAAYDFSCLQEFLDIYYQGMSVLLKEQDFYDLTWAYLQRAAADQVIHTEIFFDPQGHTERGVAFADAVGGIARALGDAQGKLGISSKLIMCFLRHLPEEDALATWDEAQPFLSLIDGVGLDSSEVGHPPSKFKNVFAKARDAGLHVVAHAGEEGPPEYVWEALDDLQVDRIDHGNRALEDAKLVKRLAEEGMCLTVCPLSNLKLCVIDDMKNHPIPAMLAAGLKPCVNADDPSYFGGYVNDNFAALMAALPLGRADIEALLRNSFEGSFMDEGDKAAALAKLDAYLASAL
ncbi:MAG: adenosine deaminase [Robiginitomaculum sp.]|nr:adenosine deaminase [Robiginitomaculum sp.]MDQ7076884.1 adenosine deaminase [Robiginitomaculum sp.]